MQIIPIEEAKTFANGKLITEAVSLQSGKVTCTTCTFTNLTLVDTVKVSVITVGILHR